jgi:hypothetical protein
LLPQLLGCLITGRRLSELKWTRNGTPAARTAGDPPRSSKPAGSSTAPILFVDMSRGVEGIIAKPLVEIDSEDTLKTIVMRAYDSSAYSSSDGKWMQLLHPL